MKMGNIEGRKKRVGQRIRCLDGTINSMDMSLSTRWEIEKDREAWSAAVHGAVKSERLNSSKGTEYMMVWAEKTWN